MFTTKVTNLNLHSTHTESLCMKMLMDVYVKYSNLSMAIKQLLGVEGPGSSMFVKLCELPEYIGLKNETYVADRSPRSGTLRHRATSDSPSMQRLTPNWDNASAKDIISWMTLWHEELRRDQQAFIEQFMSDFNCSRAEAKARTFVARYGATHGFGKESIINYCNGGTVPDYSRLERAICGTHASPIIADDYLGPKDL